MRRLVKILTVFMLTMSLAQVKASHVAGVDITYECVGQDSFLITVNVFRDCDGIDWNAPDIDVDLTSPCGGSSTVTLQTTNVTTPTGDPIPIEVSQLCPTAISSCNGGGNPGMELYTYEGIVVLNPPCNSWEIGFSPPCCRNNAILNVSSTSAYTFTTLNNVADSCNNSPKFDVSFPNPYSCVGQQVCYDYGVTEPDGDSLVYSLDTAYQSAGNPAAYNNPYTATQPIQGSQLLTIDPTSGKVQFTPNQAGSYVVVIQVCEYDRQTKALLGCVRRDMQFVVDNCTNQSPTLCTADTISNFQGNGARVDPKTVEVCYGQHFSFDIEVNDPDVSDSLSASSNITSVLPGATMNITHGTGGNPITISVSWTATIGANKFSTFSVQVQDDACPITATNTSTFNVRVVPSTYGGEDQQICKNDTTTLSAIGGDLFTWSVLQGDQNSIECDTCTSTKIYPDQTTTYRVVSDLSQTCKNSDTVVVWASNPFDVNVSDDTTICFNDSTLTLRTDPSLQNKTYSYQWGQSATLANDTIQNVTATPLYTRDYTVRVESDSGCVKWDTTTVTVSPPFPKSLSISTNNQLACKGLNTKLELSLGYPPSSCGLATTPCIGPEFNSVLGSGTNTNQANTINGTPVVYGNSENSVRAQYLIRASELQAIGMSAGKITSVAFDVSSIPFSATSTYDNFQIKMGCTTVQALNNWVTPVQTVFTPKTVNISTGWNVHTFDNKYDWDGQSNIVVEVCFNNSATSANALTNYSTTGYNSSLTTNSNGGACNMTALLYPPKAERPNMTLGYCLTPDTNAYSYKWYPPYGLSDTAAFNPFTSVGVSTTYHAVVQDTFNACVDTAEITLNVANMDVGNDTVICKDDTIQLNPLISSSCSNTNRVFKWTPSTGLSSDTVADPLISLDSTTSYNVKVIFPGCDSCTIEDSITIAVDDFGPLNIAKQHPDCGVDDGQFTFTPNGGFSPFSYSIDGGGAYQSGNPVFDSLAIGPYELMAYDSLGCRSDTTLDTLLNLGAPSIDSFTIENVNCYNVPDGSIEVFASGGLTPTYYSIDSGFTFQASNVFSNLPKGDYDIVVRSADTCASLAEPFEITQPDELTMDFYAQDDTCHQLGDGYAKAVASGGTTPYTYYWSNDSSNNDTMNIGLYAGIYDFTLVDANGCQLDTTYEITEPSELKIDSINIDSITCFNYENGRARIFASGGDSIYEYSINGGFSFTTNNLFDSLDPGSYGIQVRDRALCYTYDTIQLVEPPKVEVATNIDSVKLCVSNCVEISATGSGGNGGPFSYNWSPNLGAGQLHEICPEEDIEYAVYAYDRKECVSEIKKVDVTLYDSLDIVISNDTFFCKGVSLPLNASATGGDGSGYAFAWSPYRGLSNPTIPDPVANPDTTTTYELTVIDDCGSPPVTEEVLINVHPNPEVDYTLDTVSGCEPLTLNLKNNSTLQYNCQINYGTGNVVNACGDANLTYTNAGSYDFTITVESAQGCVSSVTKEGYVTVYPRPHASFLASPNPTSVLYPEVTFSDNSVGSVSKWQWNFASYGSSNEPNPSFEFPSQDSGTYPVRLQVESNYGCQDDTIRPIVVQQEYVMYAPSAFSPNGDNLNDVFKPYFTGVDENNYVLYVYDRWGRTVFETSDNSNGWDGTNSRTGKPASTGMYVWKLIVGDYQEERKRHEYTGDILLIR